MREIDELRPPTALRLLTIWRESGEAAETELERSLLSNAQVLAESCYQGGEPVFAHGAEVLERLTGRQMEALLRRLAQGGTEGGEGNPRFDPERFWALAR